MKKIVFNVIKIVAYILIAIITLLGASLIWLMNTWASLSYSELLFHLKSSLTGSNSDMVREAVIRYALPAVILIVIIIVGNEIIKKKINKPYYLIAVFVLLLVIDGGIISLFNSRTNIISDLAGEIFGNNQSDFIEKNYVDSSEVKFSFPDKKRNLIYIFLESTEISCSDKENGGAFSENVIPNLTELSEENENFSGDSEDVLDGAITLPGTEWTMGAMFGQSTGVPLKISFSDSSFEDNSNGFFPRIVAIGDVLEDNGYVNVLSIGSDADFGARSAFYKAHGDYVIHDYKYAKEKGLIPDDYYVFWGFEDSKLFDFAKQDLLELAQNDKPFNYTMLTVDTHFEDGYVCDKCGNEFGDNQYANVFACTDRQVTEFVNWIMQQEFYENTTIVLCGDHITMDSDFYTDIDADYQRKTYSCIINSAVNKKIDKYREYATIDMFPTTLAAMGIEMSSDVIGVGTNLYSDSQTLVEKYGIAKCKTEFAKNCPFLEKKSGIEIDETTFNKAREKIYLETADENGNVRFRLFKLAEAFNCNAINKLYFTVENSATGAEKRYDAELIKDGENASYYAIVHSDIPYEQLNNLDCKVYISIGDYKDYLLQDFSSDKFEIWDINWD